MILGRNALPASGTCETRSKGCNCWRRCMGRRQTHLLNTTGAENDVASKLTTTCVELVGDEQQGRLLRCQYPDGQGVQERGPNALFAPTPHLPAFRLSCSGAVSDETLFVKPPHLREPSQCWRCTKVMYGTLTTTSNASALKKALLARDAPAT